jgi:glycosyltransferase involved in cell wall biosynthesis
VRFVLNKVSAIVVLSEERKKWINSVSSNTKVLVVRNPAQLNQLVSAGAREPAVILSLGRLGHNKGTYVLLDAVASLSKRYPEIKLWLGGDGELDKAKQEAERLGIGNKVETLGWVNGEQKADLLERASIYALPSYAEGMPVSVLEAMAAGLPIVSTPVGGIPAAVTDGIEGFLVQPGDALALADALDRLLADSDLRHRMGAYARERIEKEYAADRILPDIAALYASISSPVTMLEA